MPFIGTQLEVSASQGLWSGSGVTHQVSGGFEYPAGVVKNQRAVLDERNRLGRVLYAVRGLGLWQYGRDWLTGDWSRSCDDRTREFCIR